MKESAIGRIAIEATIDTNESPDAAIVCEALVDTDAAYLTLPNAWRSRLGDLATLDTVNVETADQSVVTGHICGPVRLRLGDFRPVWTEALFTDMKPANGRYEPLIGYIPLAQAQAVVDLAEHRLRTVDHVDLKRASRARQHHQVVAETVPNQLKAR